METLEEALKRINNPAINKLLDLLVLSREPLPKYTRERENSYGSFYPFRNQINVHPQLIKDAESDTLGHELTHALDDRMAKHATQRPLNNMGVGRANPQFYEAWDKLNPATSKLPGLASLSAYRKSPLELRAHAFQNHMGPNQDQPAFNPAPNHIDATMATELSILMDLYERSLRRQK